MFGVMKSHEDKQKICNKLLKALKATRDQCALTALRYEKDAENVEEYVTAEYISGRTQRICVTCDSGIALIRDVVRAIR